MGTKAGDAIGSRAKVFFAEEDIYGEVKHFPNRNISLEGVLTSEALVVEQGDLRSGALRPDRGLSKRVRGTESVTGPVGFEQNPHGESLLLKHAYGRHTVIKGANGGIRGYVASAYTSGAILQVKFRAEVDFTNFPANGTLKVVYMDPSDEDNRKVRTIPYSNKGTLNTTTLTSTFTITDLPGDAIHQGAYVLPFKSVWDTGFLALVPVYTHIFEAGRELAVKTGNSGKTRKTSLTIEALRDIAVFLYGGGKINNFTETFPATEMLTGSADFLCRSEFIGSILASDVTVGQTLITLKETTLAEGGIVVGKFPDPVATAGGAIFINIGEEKNIKVTAINFGTNALTVVAAGDNSIQFSHKEGEVVGIETAESAAQSVPPTTDPFSSFEATVYKGSAAAEVLSAEYTIGNDIFPDKFPLGSRSRAKAPEQARTVEVTMTVEFDNLIHYSDFRRGVEFALELRCTSESQVVNPAELVADRVPFMKHTIFPRLEFTGTTPTAADPGIITPDLPMVAMKQVNDRIPEVVTFLVNDKADVAN